MKFVPKNGRWTSHVPSRATVILPSTLVRDPILALTPPGTCQFDDDFVEVPLLHRWDISSTTSVLRFGLPNKDKPLNLSTCACILAKANLPNRDGSSQEAVVRPYTPISTNTDIGFFDLLIKNYQENGRMSTHLCTTPIGTKVEFKHIAFNVKIQAPFRAYKKIAMIVGGTGITPMIQALHAILGDPDSNTEVTMVYGSRVSTDILGKELLDRWSKQFKNRFNVVHILSDEPADSDWKGDRGFIDKNIIGKHLPSPTSGDDFKIFICGPPPMYNALSGPRDAKELSGLLKDAGYSAEHVYKF